MINNSIYIEEINNKANINEEYFRLQNLYSSKYGKNNTILFLQVGSFYEAYQTLEKGFNLQRISDLLNILVYSVIAYHLFYQKVLRKIV